MKSAWFLLPAQDLLAIKCEMLDMRIISKLLLGSVLSMFLVCSSVSSGATPQLLPGHRPEAALAALPTGRLPADRVLRFGIGLPIRHQDKLDAFLGRLYNPASADFHHYLTPGQYADQFSPTEEAYRALIKFAEARGFRVLETHANRIFVGLSGTVEQIENAFQLNLATYQHPLELREFFAPDREPTVDPGLGILHISGLDDFVQSRPAGLSKLDGAVPSGGVPQGGSGTGGLYAGRDFRAAYAPSVSLTGAGQFVGLFELDGYWPTDITTYLSSFGMTNVPTQTVLLDEYSGAAGTNNGEVALDIEMAIAMAPGLTGLLVYEGTTPNDVLSRMAADGFVKQLSASWTFPSDAVTSQIFQQYAAQGQSYFNASGDSGSYANGAPSPVDNQYVISVGGTTLSTRGAGLGWLSEVVWNWRSTGAGTAGGGGGISKRYTLPAWQQGIATTANKASTVWHNMPDVAMVADNILVYADHGRLESVGGTSVAAPLWAAFMALVNQQAAQAGGAPAGFINPAIYAMVKTNTALFHDIVSGNNTNVNTVNYFATAGYDLCTGVGTPTGKALINALAPVPNARVVIPTAYALKSEYSIPANGAVDPGEPVVVGFFLQNVGGVNTTNLVATLLNTNGVIFAGPSQSYGALAGSGVAATRNFSFMADPAVPCGGVIHPTFQLQDGTANLGLLTFTISIGQPVSPLAQNFDGVKVPALPAGWTTTVSGASSNWITTTSARESGTISALVNGAGFSGMSELTSPSVLISSTNALLNFRQYFITEIDSTNGSTVAYDGGVLEISTNGVDYLDILAAGGSFLTNGYTRTVQSNPPGDSPLDGRRVWAGTSRGFISTTVALPASVAGQSVQFKWRLGSDNGNFNGNTLWYLDTVSMQDGISCNFVPANTDLGVTQINATPGPLLPGQSVDYLITITNNGPGVALNTVITDVLPPNVDVTSMTPGFSITNNVLTYLVPLLATGGGINLEVIFTPQRGGLLTNSLSVYCPSLVDTNNVNDVAVDVVEVYQAPEFTTQPASQIVGVGTDVTLLAEVSGTPPFSCQWSVNGTNIPGATNLVLTLTGIQPSQSGGYTITVSNLIGSVTSNPADLLVLTVPLIAVGPVSKTVLPGGSVVFEVFAAGGQPLAYQWNFGTNDISGATNSSLSLLNVQSSQAGGYSVTVFNSFGQVTSLPAQLRVLVSPILTAGAFSLTTTNFTISIESVAGQKYALEYTGSLEVPQWVQLPPPVTGDGNVIFLTDTNAPVLPARYYRAVSF